MVTKETAIKLIEKTIKLRKEMEDFWYDNGDFSRSESFKYQREDLEYCLMLVNKIKED